MAYRVPIPQYRGYTQVYYIKVSLHISLIDIYIFNHILSIFITICVYVSHCDITVFLHPGFISLKL